VRETDEAREEEVGGVDIRDSEVGEELIVLVIKVVVVFNEMLVRLMDWEVVECEGLDVERSDRISKTVRVVEVGSPVLISLLLSSNFQTAMRLNFPRRMEMQ